MITAAVLSLLSHQHVAAIVMRRPSWDAPFGAQQSSVCTNGSSASGTYYSGSYIEHGDNIRWTHYAIPEGTPPRDGWPIYMLFPPWSSSPPIALRNESCGGKPVNRACMALLRTHCDVWNRTSCYSCVRNLKETEPEAYDAAGCTPKDAYESWCHDHGHSR
eukprot:SAG11_NODE_92_length_17132_cov_10.277285_11_plen_161_part_00